MQIIRHKDAKKLGLKRYFTGKACQQGHISERYISGHCIVCEAEYSRTIQVYKRNHQYRLTHRKQINEYHYKLRQTDEYRKYHQYYHRQRYQNDKNFKFAAVLRSRLRIALKNKYKSDSSIKLLGCSIKKARQIIEARFQPDMSWQNWSRNGWHLDHIRPLTSFDLTDPIQLAEACHISNLQPLWAKDNLSKGKKANG